jgi:hypothetical protein
VEELAGQRAGGEQAVDIILRSGRNGSLHPPPLQGSRPLAHLWVVVVAVREASLGGGEGSGGGAG